MILKQMARMMLATTLLLGAANAGEKISATFRGSDGLKNKEIKALVGKLESIGYEAAGINENIQDAYFEKYHEKSLDYLSFYSVTNEKAMRELLLAYPRYGAFSPFNLLPYKKQGENKTWYGYLNPDAIMEVIGDTDPQRAKAYRKMHADLDALVEKEMKPQYTKSITYKAIAKKPMLEMVRTIDRSKDLEDVLDDFWDAHDEAFEDAEFIIAGFFDFKEAYTDAKLPFDKYDAFWINILCHFKFSNGVFNHGDPQAGVFAPCSVYFYIEKGSNKLHVGMARVENWATMAGVTDPAKIESMHAIDAEIVKVFHKLGFVEEGKAAAATGTEKKAPAAKAVAASMIKHGAKYMVGKVLEKTPTYLVAGAASVEDVAAKLKTNGFEILATTPILENESVITVTNETLKKTNGFVSVLNVLVNNAAHEVRVQNPDYLGRAYLGKAYQAGMFDQTIQSLEAALGEIYASEESMETDDLPGYHFMMGMPYVGDTIALASGSDLDAKAQKSEKVAYTLALPNGATLVGHKLGKRTSKFLKKIGVTQNAALLPYTVLVKDGKAEMLDPKYYLALSLPQLSMGEFMKIATIPDAIKKELTKVYK